MGEVTFGDRMGEVDALMWAMEADPVLRSTVVAVARLDGPPDRARLTARVRRSIDEIPRLHQVAVDRFLRGTPKWVAAADVDLGYHLRFHGRPGDGSEGGLLGLVDEIAAVPFDRSRPLWQHTVVEDLADGRAALVVKVHHSLTDGVGGMEIAAGLLFDLAAEEPPAPSPAPPAPSDPVPEGGSRPGLAREARRQGRRVSALARGGGRLVRRPSDVLRTSLRSAGSALRAVSPFSGALSPLLLGRSPHRRHHEFPVALDALRAAARGADARVNDAFLAAVAGGLARYHDLHDAPVDALRVTMPISIRAAGADVVAGNRHAPSRFHLPVGEPDPRLRMQTIARRVTAERAEPALRFAEPFAGLLRRLPAGVRLRLFGRMLKGVDVLASNIPGVTFPLYLAGARLEGLVAFGPPLGAALNVTLLSYLDRASIGVVTDTLAVPDPEVLVACLKEGFDEVLKAK